MNVPSRNICCIIFTDSKDWKSIDLHIMIWSFNMSPLWYCCIALFSCFQHNLLIVHIVLIIVVCKICIFKMAAAVHLVWLSIMSQYCVEHVVCSYHMTISYYGKIVTPHALVYDALIHLHWFSLVGLNGTWSDLPIYYLSAQVLKICRTPGLTACLKIYIHRCVWKVKERTMTGPRQPWTCSHLIYAQTLTEVYQLAFSLLFSFIYFSFTSHHGAIHW